MRRGTRLGVSIAIVSLLLGIWADVLFRGRPLGLNVVLFTAGFVAALAILLRVARAPLHQGRRWMAAPLLLFAAAFVWHDSPWLTAANLVAVAGAVTLGALRRTRPRVAAAGVADYAAGLGTAGFSAVAGAVHLIHADIDWSDVRTGLRSRRTGAIVRGLALGAPLVALFGGLFIAADAIFRNLAATAVPSGSHFVEHVAVVGVFGWLAAGLLRDLVEAREERRVLAPAVGAARRLKFTLGATELAVALAVVDVLFLAFVLVQIRYLFGGQGLVEARAHLTYAQYARHGFFELVTVSVLVLALLLAVDAVVRRDRPRGVWVVRALSAVLLALVLVVMASALQRMRLYEQQYGLTELRIYVTGVIAWLGLVFAWFAVTALRGRRHAFAIGALVAGFAVTAGLNVLSPDALIARTNLTRPHVDARYVGSLSDDAVPVLLDRLPGLRPDLRTTIAAELLRRSPGTGGWASANVSRSRARRALRAHHAELEAFALGR